jgi:hypothetical protein
VNFREATEFLLSLNERFCAMAYLVDDFEVRISVSADLELSEVADYLVENRELLEIDDELHLSSDYIQVPRREWSQFIGVTLEDGVLVILSEVMCGDDGEGEFLSLASDYQDLIDALVGEFGVGGS